MARSRYALTLFRIMGLTTGREWYNPGTRCASKEDISKLQSHYLALETLLAFGRDFGQWAIWADRVMRRPRMDCGRIATTMCVMLESPQTRAKQMGSTCYPVCVYRLALAMERITHHLGYRAQHQKSTSLKQAWDTWTPWIKLGLFHKVPNLHHSISGMHQITVRPSFCFQDILTDSLTCIPDYVEVYDPLITTMNTYRGGTFQQAMSGVTTLNNEWYNGNAYQTYAFEYTPGASGKINWFVGETSSWAMDARAVRPNGNVGQRVIPMEPMAMIMNFGMSNGFSALNFTGLGTLLPATMRFDYVRIYQNNDALSVGCDPADYPTHDYIQNHADAYQNPNKTQWCVHVRAFGCTTKSFTGLRLPTLSRKTPC